MSKKTIIRTALAVVAAAALITGAAILEAPRASAASMTFPDPPSQPASSTSTGAQTAVLAGGCFWGMEGVFERLKGVIDVTSGYSGGSAATAHYEMVGTGTTGHAESVKIAFDPSKISYGTLLKIFFSVAHDPTELNYQGPDVGTQYRSAIFYANQAQKLVAERYIEILNSSGVFPRPIVTQVVPLAAFYPAEDYHQNFMDSHPDYPYIVMWDAPKVERLAQEYPTLVARRE